MNYSHLLTRGVRALLACAAMLPIFANAQSVEMMSVRFVRSDWRVGAETSPGRWMWNNTPYTEVKRTDTAIMLRPDTAGNTPIMLDISRKQVFMDHNGENYNGRIDEIGTATGGGVGRIELMLGQPNPYGRLLPDIGATFDANGGTDAGWSVHLAHYNTASIENGKILASAAQRDARSVTLKYGTRTYVIDVVSGTCQSAGYVCQVRRIVPVSGKDVGHIKIGRPIDASQWAMMMGITQTSTTSWRMEDAGGSADMTEVARTSEYIELRQANSARLRIPTDVGKPVQVLYPGGGWEPYGGMIVAHAQRQWPGQLGTIFAPVAPGVSPGFQIQNKTDYPVLVTLEQIGCLYYGIVQPGQVFQRNTGAVWFTIKASMAPDLKEPTVASCIRTPAIYAAKIAIAGAMVMGTAGMGTALVVPAMLGTAAGQGSAIAIEQAELASGATRTGAAVSRVSVSTLARGLTVVGLVLHAGSSLPGAVGSALTDSWVSTATGGAYVGGVALTERYTQQSDIDGIDGQLTQEARVFGAYAGYPWPWKMVDRVMPRYDITGGPRIRTLQDGTTVVLTQERALTITRVN